MAFKDGQQIGLEPVVSTQDGKTGSDTEAEIPQEHQEHAQSAKQAIDEFFDLLRENN